MTKAPKETSEHILGQFEAIKPIAKVLGFFQQRHRQRSAICFARRRDEGGPFQPAHFMPSCEQAGGI